MSFIHRHHVRFAEVDAAGIVFFSRAFEFAHAAFEALLSDAGLPLAELLASAPWALPLVHVEADYRSPMRLGDVLDIAVGVERLGNTSVTFRFTVTGGQPRAVIRHVHVCIDKTTGRPTPLPADLRSALGRYSMDA